MASAAAAPQPQANQPSIPPAPSTSWAPTAKVSIGVLASAIVTMIAAFWSKSNPLTPAETGALTSIITFIVQYWTPERK